MARREYSGLSDLTRESSQDNGSTEELTMKGTRRFCAVVSAMALGFWLASAVAARDLSVVSWGGAYQDAQKEVYFKPFMEKTKVKMVDESWDGGIGVLRAKMQGGANNWDVVQVESEELLVGCEEGLCEQIEWGHRG